MSSENPRLKSGNRVTSGSRIGAVDGLRALACLMVYLYHIWEFGGSPALVMSVGFWSMSLGTQIAEFPAGVDVFMALSGFCLFWPLCRHPERCHAWSWRDYLRRRIRRIVPPYYASIVYVTLLPVVLVVLYRVLGKSASWQQMPSLWQYVSHMLFIHTLSTSTWDGIQGVYWSLGLEMQFYLAFPFVVYAYRKWGIQVVAWMIGTSIVYRMGAAVHTANSPWETRFVFSIFFLGRWMLFAGGMLAAWIVARTLSSGVLISRGRGTVLFLGAVACYFVAVSRASQAILLVPARELGLAVACGGMLVALCASNCPVRCLFENRVAVFLGGISYSIFLLHQNTIYYFGELLKKQLGLPGEIRLVLMATIGLGFVIVLSYGFHLVFERPFMSAPPKDVREVLAEPAPAQ